VSEHEDSATLPRATRRRSLLILLAIVFLLGLAVLAVSSQFFSQPDFLSPATAMPSTPAP
jgi:flagellar basal body-associated protein FliL